MDLIIATFSFSEFERSIFSHCGVYVNSYNINILYKVIKFLVVHSSFRYINGVCATKASSIFIFPACINFYLN